MTDKQQRVTPFDISVAVDVKSHDGSIQGGEFVDAWLQSFQIVTQSPELMQTLDVPRMFLHVARLMGAENAEDFMRNTAGMTTQVLPDQQVAEQLEAGNITPLGAVG